MKQYMGLTQHNAQRIISPQKILIILALLLLSHYYYYFPRHHLLVLDSYLRIFFFVPLCRKICFQNVIWQNTVNTLAIIHHKI